VVGDTGVGVFAVTVAAAALAAYKQQTTTTATTSTTTTTILKALKIKKTDNQEIRDKGITYLFCFCLCFHELHR
jgi:hypothetical protein